MKNLAVILGVLWLVLRVALDKTDYFENDFSVSVMINMLFMVIIIYKAVRELSMSGVDFLEVVKGAMRKVSVYAFIVAVSIFAFYKYIGTDFIEDRVADYHTLQTEQIESQGGWEEIQKSDPMLKNMTEDQYFEEQSQKATDLITPWFIASFSLFIMIIGAVLYSLLSALLFRKMLKSVNR